MAWIDDEGRIHRGSDLPPTEQSPQAGNKWSTIVGWTVAIILAIVFIPILGNLFFRDELLTHDAPTTQKIKIIDFQVSEIEMEYGERIQLRVVDINPINATVEDITVEFEIEDCLFIDNSGFISTMEYSNWREPVSTNMMVTINEVTKIVPVYINNTYAAEWSMSLPQFIDSDGAAWTSYDLVFVNPVPNCTGFSLHWTITKSPANDIGKDWRVYVFSQYGWEHMDDIPIQELNRRTSVEISFPSRTIYGVVVYPPFDFSGGNWSSTGEITELQYIK